MAYNTPVYSYAGVPVAPAGFYNNDPYALQPPGYGRVLPPSLGAAPTRTWDSLMGPPRATNPGYGSSTMPYNQPQYNYGQGNFGGYSAPNTPNLYANAYPSANTQGGPAGYLTGGAGIGGQDWLNLLSDPKGMVMKLLSQEGINPFSGGLGVNMIMDQAKNLVGQIPTLAALSGANAGVPADANMMGNIGRQLIQRALSGQSVYLGGGQAQNALNQLDMLSRGVGPEQVGTVGALARSLVGSPSDYANTLQQLLFSGVNGSVGRALGSDLLGTLPSLLTAAAQANPNATALQLIQSGVLRNPFALYGTGR